MPLEKVFTKKFAVELVGGGTGVLGGEAFSGFIKGLVDLTTSRAAAVGGILSKVFLSLLIDELGDRLGARLPPGVRDLLDEFRKGVIHGALIDVYAGLRGETFTTRIAEEAKPIGSRLREGIGIRLGAPQAIPVAVPPVTPEEAAPPPPEVEVVSEAVEGGELSL